MYEYMHSVELSLTDLCNMQCVFCPHSTTFANKANYMSIETLQCSLDHILSLDQSIQITLNGRGEPTLHPEFESLVKLLSSRIASTNHTLSMGTNGARLSKYSHLISMFSRINLNIYDEHSVSEIKNLLNTYSTYSNIRILLKRTDVKKKMILNRAQSSFFIKNFSNRAGSVNHATTCTPFKAHQTYGSACHKPFTSAYIEYNGDYSLCCDDWSRSLKLGNVHKQSIKELYTKNNTFRDIAIDLLHGKREQYPCKNCNRKLRWYDEFSETHFEALQREYL